MTKDNEFQIPEDATLLLVDDDTPFLNRLARAMDSRGFAVEAVDTVAAGIEAVRRAPPAFAVVDMRLEDGNGLDVISALHAARPDARAIVLTGYGNIATAVTAVKMGCRRLSCKNPPMPTTSARLCWLRRVKKPIRRRTRCRRDRVAFGRHIQRVYELCDRNVSETARRLNMHRRTLQRILAKRAPR